MSSNIEVKRICEYCEKEFIARTTVTRYCSSLCNKRDYKNRLRNDKIKANDKEVLATRNKVLEQIKLKEFLNINDTAILLDTSKRSVYRMIKRGTINSVNLAERKTIIRRTDIESLFQDRSSQDEADPLPNTDNETVARSLSLEEWVKAGGENVSDCYTLTEIQQKYGISEKAVQELLKRNQIPKLKLGWYAYVPKKIIDKILSKGL